VGYNSAGGLTEVTLDLTNLEGTMTVHSFGEGSETNIYSGQIEGMVLPCKVSKK
jgi:hypothetical protein